MLKTAKELSTQLKDAKGTRQVLQLDPVTSLERKLRSLAVIAFFALWVTGFPAYKIGLEKGFVYVCISGVSLLAILFIFTYNEYWELDLSKRQCRASSSWLGIKSVSKSFEIPDVVQVALSGTYHSRKSKNSPRRYWWEYGLAVLTKDGTLHEVFPNLSKNYKDVWDATEALAEILEAPMLEPVPFAKLDVIKASGSPVLTYGESQEKMPRKALFNSTSKVKAEEKIENRLETKKTAKSSEALAPSVSEPHGRYEIATDSNEAIQAGCALFGLFFAGPFLLVGLGLLFASDIGSKIGGLVLGLLSAPVVYWMMGWLISPVTRTVTYVDPEGTVGSQQFRRRGKPTETEVEVPQSARVVLKEGTNQARRAWALTVKDGSSSLWRFALPKSREQGEEEGRKIAQILGIPFELDSDFER